MIEEKIFNLKINQLVKIKCKNLIDGFFIANVKSINDWTKRVGVVDSNNNYEEYPYKSIMESF